MDDSEFIDIGFAKIDIGREARTGLPEVVFARGKKTWQVEEAVKTLSEKTGRALATGVRRRMGEKLTDLLPGGEFDALAGLFKLGAKAPAGEPRVAVLTGGTADLPVAEEAAQTLEFFGHPVERVYDVGVAGLNRILGSLDKFRDAEAVIAIAGMDGAMPAVAAGLIKAPIIAVPTSANYGAGANGIAPLLAMLNACAPGVAVVNIDNGFGAAAMALRILD
ncbi:MAG: nickel pincer cofactor biosynthesis protein LarB [Verrucomicrobiales bacterium]